jgi:hypothetical protein
MVCGNVPPFIHRREVLQVNPVRGVSGQVQLESEPVEVPLQVVEIRIPVFECRLNRELSLHHSLERGPDPCHDDLSAFRVQIAAEALEMRAQKHDVAPKVLLREAGIRGSRRQ